ncbi:MAG TPA: ATP-binding protein [Pirellulales bacterium]|nr:ATP-binding protein [Pirellulales bacterium]
MTAPMVAVSMLLLAVGIVSAWYVHNLQKDNSDILALDVASMFAAEDIEIKMREVRSNLNRYLREGDARYLDEVPSLEQTTERLLTAARQSARRNRELDFISEIEQGCRQFFDEIDRARDSGSVELAVGELVADTRIERDIFQPARDYIDYHRKIVEETRRETQAMAERMGLGLLLLGICGSVAGLLAGFGIARGISRSIVQLSVPVHGVAGKLNEVVGPITLSATAGFEELESALQDMADHVGTVIERLEQREREVLRGEQLAAVGQLAAGVAHELRNPLMAIKILVQSAAEGRDGALRGRDLAVVEEEIGRLERSIQALLDFARPPKPETVALDLRQLARQTVELVSARAEQQRVCLACQLPEQAAVVEVDGVQIRQVLLNLLFNALDAMSDGGEVRIAVLRQNQRQFLARDDAEPQRPALLSPASAAPHQELLMGEAGEPDDGYVVRVADAGSGLPTELGNRIFEPFVSTKETGTGLGLPICRRIIEDHGGEIKAQNGSQGGAEFLVWLPRARRGTAASPDARAPAIPVDALELTHAAPARS